MWSMSFIDEEDRLGAIRVARGAAGRAGIALGLVIAAPAVAVFFHPLLGLFIAVAALGLAITSVRALSHPQASVIGALRTVGLLLGGVVILASFVALAYGVNSYRQWQKDKEMFDRANQMVH